MELAFVLFLNAVVLVCHFCAAHPYIKTPTLFNGLIIMKNWPKYWELTIMRRVRRDGEEPVVNLP